MRSLNLWRDIDFKSWWRDHEDIAIVQRLSLSGLVEPQNGKLQVKNWIYREVFNPTWLRQQLDSIQTEREVSVVVTLSAEIEKLLEQKCDRAEWLQAAILEKLWREGSLPENQCTDPPNALQTDHEPRSR